MLKERGERKMLEDQECGECRDRREQETSGVENEKEWRQKAGKRRKRERARNCTVLCYLGDI